MKVNMYGSGFRMSHYWSVILVLAATIICGTTNSEAQSCSASGSTTTWDGGKTIISICNGIHSVVKSVDILGMLPDVTLVPILSGTSQTCTETNPQGCTSNCGTYKTTTGGIGITMHGSIPTDVGFTWNFNRVIFGVQFKLKGHVGITGAVDGSANGNVTYTLNCDNSTSYNIHGTVDSTLTLSGGGSLKGTAGSLAATATVSMDTPFPGTLNYAYSSGGASATFCVGKIEPTFTFTFPGLGSHNYSGPVLYPGNC